MKKLILFFIFIPAIIQAAQFTLVAKPGKLLYKTGVIYLKCEDNSYDECAYSLDLEPGTYKYISGTDSALIAIDSTGAYELGAYSDHVLRIIQ